MGIEGQLKNLIGAKKKVAVSITEVGIDRLEKQFGTGYEMRILQKLHDNGPMTLSELSQATGYDPEIIKAVTVELKDKQCIARAR